ncbi:helix-turn-helix domain-containing protein [Rhodocaloribacter litoris]|uniref:helix-turn-helix domain-containing protein n=1 Tax=Rhodocaloribacter litoris TaxID=2558931 RepID=UPI0014213614|nr:helix-turn-helix domain-containing protein [Rhodocaloribacter litoris]QXD17062.1 helix-turn-helix domain-containing protein [Rhodocaloribacter litoris]
MPASSSPGDPLLTLKQAAARLSVHPTTLRRWADQGAIPVVVTPGGHRRFPRSAVEQLRIQRRGDTGEPVGKALAERALTHTRAEIAGHRDERWLAELDEHDREEKRLLGQRVMGLMMQYISLEGDDGADLLAEARALGHVYAESARHSGLSLTEAIQATLFFRDQIVESAIMLPETTRGRTTTNRRLLRRINTFLNTIQLAITEAYER